MEEDIKILENLIKDFERIEKFNVEEKEIFSPYNKFVEIIKSIKNIIARNKELEKNLKFQKKLTKIAQIITDESLKEALEEIEKDYILKSKIKQILYPTPENPIDLEIQNSKTYKDLLKLIGE